MTTSDNSSSLSRTIRIATRASKLALWQAHYVEAQLKAAHAGLIVEVVHISTIGDRDRSVPLWEMGGQGVFTREVQRALFENDADIAVHSLKDLPTQPLPGLTLAAVPERANVYDALVLLKEDSENSVDGIDSLPENARVGTSSLRRQAQLKFHRPDLQMLDIRGNVETRLQKLDDGEYDAIILACAGLERLEFSDRISSPLKPPLVFPAVGQGALGIECRSDDEEVIEILKSLSDLTSLQAVTAERATLRTLQAGCHAPVGIQAELVDGKLVLHCVVLNAEGTERLESKRTTENETPEELGIAVANDLLDQGAAALIE